VHHQRDACRACEWRRHEDDAERVADSLRAEAAALKWAQERWGEKVLGDIPSLDSVPKERTELGHPSHGTALTAQRFHPAVAHTCASDTAARAEASVSYSCWRVQRDENYVPKCGDRVEVFGLVGAPQLNGRYMLPGAARSGASPVEPSLGGATCNELWHASALGSFCWHACDMRLSWVPSTHEYPWFP
jgi:hypothetical protein